MDMTAADRGTQIHTEAENFVRGEGDFTKHLAKFATYFDECRTLFFNNKMVIEENWGFTKDWMVTGWFDDNIWMRMKLDNFIDVATDDKTGVVVIGTATDYKSGKKFGNEVAHNQQGQIYVLGSFLRYPSLEVCNIDFKYLDHGLETRKTYTREKAMKFFPSWDKRLKAMTSATTFPPKPNKINCMWCPFGPNKGDGSCEWGVDSK
jgi:hypothetical protein